MTALGVIGLCGLLEGIYVTSLRGALAAFYEQPQYEMLRGVIHTMSVQGRITV